MNEVTGKRRLQRRGKEMPMDLSEVYNTKASWLAQMLDVKAGDQELWKPKELRAILNHQLAASLDADLRQYGNRSRQQRTVRDPADGPPIESFRDLLFHPSPPVGMLEGAKEFARNCRKRPECLLPEEIAAMLYILSIVVARIRCRRRITKLDDHALQDALRWALEQSWMDEPTRELLQEGYQVISCREHQSDV
jgi:hypothetical protein